MITCFLPRIVYISVRNLSVTGPKCAFSIISFLIVPGDKEQRSPLTIFPALLNDLSEGVEDPIN